MILHKVKCRINQFKPVDANLWRKNPKEAGGEAGAGGYYYNGSNLEPSDIEDAMTAGMMADGTIDTEPDIFSYSFAGQNGKFFFDANSETSREVNFITKNNLKLEWEVTSNQFDYFIITTPDGVKYYFGDVQNENIDAYESTDKTFSNPLGTRSSWHLVRVESADGNYQINLTYVDDWKAYKTPATCKRVYSECRTQEQIGNNVFGSSFDGYVFYDQLTCTSNSNNGPNHPWIKMANKGKRLSTITTSTCMVSFIAETNRDDLEIYPDASVKSKQLDRIEIESGTYKFEYNFSYDYWHDETTTEGNISTNAEAKRLRLNSLQKISDDGQDAEEPYKFTYITKENQPDFLPFRLSKAIDHWGFYNGQESNNSKVLNVPDTKVFGRDGTPLSYADFVVRESDETSMLYGALQQIKYPTGGTTNFTFEANDVSIVENGTPTRYTTTSCSNPVGNECCGINSNESTYTFADEQEIRDAFFELCLEIPSETDCNTSSMDDEVTVKVEILEPINTGENNESTTYKVIGGWGYGIQESFADPSFCLLEDGGAPLTNILCAGNVLTPGIQYKFRVESFDAFGVFELIILGPLDYTERAVGGLRVKEMRIKDGIEGNSNDIVKTYKYRVDDDTRSSGVLVYEPSYGHYLEVSQAGDEPLFSSSLTGSSVQFSSESIVPLSSFEGYHIRYRLVEENHNGNGKSIYRNHIEVQTPPPVAFYPIPPEQVRVRDAKTEEQYHYKIDGMEEEMISSTTIIPDFQYTEIEDFAAKVIRTELECAAAGGGPMGGLPTMNIIGYTQYKNRIGHYLNGTVTSVVDGVETITQYEYDHADGLHHLYPTATIMTNSNNIEYRTENEYAFDMKPGFIDIVRTDLVERNIIYPPLEQRQFVNEKQVSGTRTVYSFFKPDGTIGTFEDDLFPYPRQFYDYKANADGTSSNPADQTKGYYELEGTIEEYWANSETGKGGYPKKFIFEDWDEEETYDWENGLIKERKYKDFTWQYEYHTDTRLVSKIIDIDGQPVFYNYDQLMRLEEVLARPKESVTNHDPNVPSHFNVVTNYTYNFQQEVPAGTTAPDNNYNYVRTRTDFASAGNASELAFQESTQYMDGLGRPIQMVQTAHSTENEQDVITAQTYDNQGRVDKVYEPFESSANDGDYQAIPTATMYTSTRYEASPLNRILGVTPPDWHETTTEYGTNDASEVTGYAANQLMKVIVTDPNGNKSLSFKDKRGRLILSKRTNEFNNQPGGNADTYYEYDNKDRLLKVIPPGAASTNDDLTYRYAYDDENRMLSKNIPGAATMNMLYDNRDLMVASQDGLLLENDRWLITQYDDYGRPTQTGFYKDMNGAGVSPDPNNTTINDGLLTDTYYDGGSNVVSERKTDAIYIGKVHKTRTRLLNGFDAADYDSDTGSGLTNWIENRNTYDAFGRVSLTNGNNHLKINNVIKPESFTFSYDYADNMTSSNRNHMGHKNILTYDDYRYDHKGRQSKLFHRISYQGQLAPQAQQICNLVYDHEDQITARSVGGINNGADFLQTIDYTYNEQGWLETINQVLPAVAESTSSSQDLFYMKIFYDDELNFSDDGIGNPHSAPAQKNGNIAHIEWQTAGKGVTTYGFKYDYLDRLTAARYGTGSGSTPSYTGTYDTDYTYADARGNISAIKREGTFVRLDLTTTTGLNWAEETIDDLQFTYESNSNRISSITESGVATGTFGAGCTNSWTVSQETGEEPCWRHI
ncbi:MAG: DUF6443 domain-containing protein [Bacteroidota bacterium]